MTFQARLIQERKRLGLSQEDLAARLNVSRQAVSKWETGESVPDLPKLLTLADALGISLDALCGREEAPPAPAISPSSAPRKTVWALAAACILLFVLLAGAILLLLRPDSPTTPGVSPLSLTEEFTVSGLNFSGKSEVAVAYQFTPSISGEGLSYQIIFTDFDGNSYPVDAPCSGGVCSGKAALPGGYLSYGVTVRVTDGTISRNVAVAHSLDFSQGHASWKPID